MSGSEARFIWAALAAATASGLSRLPSVLQSQVSVLGMSFVHWAWLFAMLHVVQ